MEKHPTAYRTISEVAREVGLEPHVLRFWESKFPQLQPLKRAGGRSTFPQIFIGKAHVGGCDELHALERGGKLDELLSPAA